MEAWERKFIDDFVREGKLNNSGSKGIDDSLKAFANPILQAIKRAVGKVERNVVVTSCENLGIPVEKYIYVVTNDGVVYGDYAVSAFSVLLWIGGEWVNLFNAESLIEEHNVSEDAHEDIRQIIDGKADKVSNATSGHLAGLDGNGNLTDSGVNPNDVENNVFIAEYNVTTLSALVTAYNAGKCIILKLQLGFAYLMYVNNTSTKFVFCYIDDKAHDVANYSDIPVYYYVCENYQSSWRWRTSGVQTIPKKSHTSTTNEYGEGSENSYGHVQLTGSVTQNSSKAVKSGAVYDALQVIRGDIANKQNTLASNSLAFINKSSSGGANKFLNEQGNFVTVDGIPVQKIVVGQTLQRRPDCLYSYGSNNVLYVMTGWIERRQSGAAYEMILRTVNTDSIAYMKVLITEQFVVYTVSGINGFLYNIWNLQDSINTDVVLVTYKEGVINPPFDALINAVHNRRDVLLAVYLENEAQEYYRLKWWKLYNSDNIYSFVFSTYIESNHTFKSYVFDYNTGGVLQNVFPRVFSPISSVGTNNINDGAVTNAKLANNAVYGDKISNGAITRLKIADDAVWTDKLVDNAVTSPKIADGAIDARHKLTALCEWTRDSAVGSSNLKITTCGGSSSGGSSTISTNRLSAILSSYGESMIFVDNTYNGTTTIYCNVDELPKFSWIHFTICATNRTSSHKVNILFRTNSSTTLYRYMKGTTSGSNTDYTYPMDAGECADFYLLRGGDVSGKCTLYLQQTYIAIG